MRYLLGDIMPTYSYICPDHGKFDVFLSMSECVAVYPCMSCERGSRRLFSAPSLNLGDSRARQLLDATKETADRPRVVSSLPSNSRKVRQKVSHNPLHKKLPKS
ncbi:MAG: FmdB family transcriptional regulator [Actinomycetales bacterium]|nr:MAG: FmdB family transcriptional regulator [Actinomycetales bacterium]